LAQLVGELNDQDAVLRHQPDEGDESDLAVDVERREPEEGEEQSARNGERRRSSEDDEGIAETLELSGQHEEDQDPRKQEDAEELAALGAELPRLPGVVDGVAGRQRGLRLVLEESQRLIQRDRRRDDALNAHRAELL